MSMITSLFTGPPKPDTSAQDALIKKQQANLDAQEAAQAEEQRKRNLALSASRSAGAGRAGSLLDGLQLGVSPVDSGRRTSLG